MDTRSDKQSPMVAAWENGLMLKAIMITLAIVNGGVEEIESDEFGTLEDCQLVADMATDSAVMRYRFGYPPIVYVCREIIEAEA